LVLKIWAGLKITSDDKIQITPVLILYLKSILEKKFQITIEIDSEKFQS